MMSDTCSRCNHSELRHYKGVGYCGWGLCSCPGYVQQQRPVPDAAEFFGDWMIDNHPDVSPEVWDRMREAFDAGAGLAARSPDTEAVTAIEQERDGWRRLYEVTYKAFVGAKSDRDTARAGLSSAWDEGWVDGHTDRQKRESNPYRVARDTGEDT